MANFVKLPNGIIFDTDLLQIIGRQDINQYVAALENCPLNLKLDSADVALLEEYLGVHTLVAPEVPAIVAA